MAFETLWQTESAELNARPHLCVVCVVAGRGNATAATPRHLGSAVVNSAGGAVQGTRAAPYCASSHIHGGSRATESSRHTGS